MQMTLKGLVPIVRELPLLDRLRLIHILAEELAQSPLEDVSPLEPYKVYELYTPYDSYGVADQLMELLHLSESNPC